jgi:hypothetical protein
MNNIDYILRVDAVPEVWQFLNGLSYKDLIAELVQNELDAEAKRTCISFKAKGLVCEGDGIPVDPEGWTRLSYFRGAGEHAPRKRHRIGVKNHGLKTCFTLGDEIVIRSDGKLFKQTLYGRGPDAAPAPGTFQDPIPDRGAPATGCRIEVPYRLKPLRTTVGESFEFLVPDEQKIEAIFGEACGEIPERFIGVIRPGQRGRYTIELRHHSLGGVTFTFRCTPAIKLRGGHLFHRTCEVRSNLAERRSLIRESVFVFSTPLPAGSAHELPTFYETPRGFLAEIAWGVNTRGATDRDCWAASLSNSVQKERCSCAIWFRSSFFRAIRLRPRTPRNKPRSVQFTNH